MVSSSAVSRGPKNINDPQGRASTGSINLEPIIKKKAASNSQNHDPFCMAQGMVEN